jgi:hypothetical protein
MLVFDTGYTCDSVTRHRHAVHLCTCCHMHCTHCWMGGCYWLQPNRMMTGVEQVCVSCVTKDLMTRLGDASDVPYSLRPTRPDSVSRLCSLSSATTSTECVRRALTQGRPRGLW